MGIMNAYKSRLLVEYTAGELNTISLRRTRDDRLGDYTFQWQEGSMRLLTFNF